MYGVDGLATGTTTAQRRKPNIMFDDGTNNNPLKSSDYIRLRKRTYTFNSNLRSASAQPYNFDLDLEDKLHNVKYIKFKRIDYDYTTSADPTRVGYLVIENLNDSQSNVTVRNERYHASFALIQDSTGGTALSGSYQFEYEYIIECVDVCDIPKLQIRVKTEGSDGYLTAFDELTYINVEFEIYYVDGANKKF